MIVMNLITTPKIDFHCHIGIDVDGKKQSARTILRHMRKYNITNTVIFPFDTQPSDGFKKENMMVLKTIKKHPQLIGFARLDPKHPDVFNEMKKAKQSGLKGIKLHPRSQQFNLNEISSVFEHGEKIGLPFLIHSAHKEGVYQKQLAEVVPSYPNLIIILAHAGLGDPQTVVRLAQEFDNVYLEISINHRHDIQLIISTAGADKVIFGSDAPYQDIGIMIERMQIDWPDEEGLRKVMFKNAEKILGLSP
jgi:predicted TIM-barrel fold metal-dependent hydrolase